jgi:hypothetical protein
VVKPGGYLVTAVKAGDSQLRRGGHSTGLGVEFDVYWLSPREMERQLAEVGFAIVFWGGAPPSGRRAPRTEISARPEVRECFWPEPGDQLLEVTTNR